MSAAQVLRLYENKSTGKIVNKQANKFFIYISQFSSTCICFLHAYFHIQIYVVLMITSHVSMYGCVLINRIIDSVRLKCEESHYFCTQL